MSIYGTRLTLKTGEQVVIDVQTTGTFRLAKIETHKRHYEIA